MDQTFTTTGNSVLINLFLSRSKFAPVEYGQLGNQGFNIYIYMTGFVKTSLN